MEKTSHEDTQDYVQVKRFLESLIGDPETRQLSKGPYESKVKKLKELGIDFLPEAVGLIWDDYQHYRQLLNTDEVKKYPELESFARRNKLVGENLAKWSISHLNTGNPLLDAWRRRMRWRSNSETGVTAKNEAQLLFSYELSKGCSIGCHFCAFSPEKLKGYLAYTPKNASFWQNILQISREIAGDVGQLSILYHATEPFDNPDYFQFAADFQELFGVLPQTTTAAPFRNQEMTREMIERRKTNPVLPDRISVLNLSTLHKIHRTYTPRELEHVLLVINSPESLQFIAASGRARTSGKRQSEDAKPLLKKTTAGELLEPTTVECTYGFLVNLFEKNLKLISPCTANDQWPLGYRIHFESNFQNLNEYKTLIRSCINQHMPQHPSAEVPVAFRQDLRYQRLDEGFTLSSPYFDHKVKKNALLPLLGDAIATGNFTPGEIAMNLAKTGVFYTETTQYIQMLFDKGLLAE